MLNQPFELLLATRNSGKIAELIDSLAMPYLKFRLLGELANVNDVDETGKTYEQNAALKAANYSSQTGIAALADDSGLEVDALNGEPGVLSARFGGGGISDHARILLLLKSLEGLEANRRTARFVCCMALFGKKPGKRFEYEGPQILGVSRGICEGSIATKPSGANGFGFDPVFIPAGYDSPFAALEPSVKTAISHRAKAARQIREVIEGILAQT